MADYEVEHDFPHIGKRVVLLNACIVLYEKAHKNILLSIEDITTRRALERENLRSERAGSQTAVRQRTRRPADYCA
jgi:hypothetical protein